MTYPIACFSSSLWTGTTSFPRKRLMMGLLLANLSFTSISNTSVGKDTKLKRCECKINKYLWDPLQTAFLHQQKYLFLFFFDLFMYTMPINDCITSVEDHLYLPYKLSALLLIRNCSLCLWRTQEKYTLFCVITHFQCLPGILCLLCPFENYNSIHANEKITRKANEYIKL